MSRRTLWAMVAFGFLAIGGAILLRSRPDDAKAYVIRGVAYEDKGDFDRAIADYNKAIKLEPDFAGAYHYRGLIYRKKETVATLSGVLIFPEPHRSQNDSRRLIFRPVGTA